MIYYYLCNHTQKHLLRVGKRKGNSGLWGFEESPLVVAAFLADHAEETEHSQQHFEIVSEQQASNLEEKGYRVIHAPRNRTWQEPAMALDDKSVLVATIEAATALVNEAITRYKKLDKSYRVPTGQELEVFNIYQRARRFLDQQIKDHSRDDNEQAEM